MKRVLVVDDEAYMREMIDDMLSDEYEIKQAENGVEALNLLESDSYDLVITDLVMPEMNGIDLLMNIDKKTPGQKVVAISGGGGLNGRFDYLPVAKLIGACTVIRKPFEVMELRKAVEDILA